MIRRRLGRLLRGLIGDDGVAMVWERLSPAGREVLRLAHLEVRELGHPCLADEHVLLGLLRHGSNEAARLLQTHGLDLDTARADLLAVGPAMGPRPDPRNALRAMGIDVDRIRGNLETTFGARAVRAAERRVRRRPWWRGGHRRPRPLCGYLLAKHSFHVAGDQAASRGDTHVEPLHLLYGVLRDARDPLGTHVGTRERATLSALGWNAGRPNPVKLILQGRGVDIDGLATRLAASAS